MIDGFLVHFPAVVMATEVWIVLWCSHVCFVQRNTTADRSHSM